MPFFGWKNVLFGVLVRDQMKRSEVTQEQFAIWSFERDREVNLYSMDAKFENLPKDEWESYLEEADYYLKETDDWPVDILDRLSE